MNPRRLTAHDIRILSSQNWRALDEERRCPATLARLADEVLSLTLVLAMWQDGITRLDHRLLAFWKAETLEPRR